MKMGKISDLTSSQLLDEEKALILQSSEISDAIEIVDIAKKLSLKRNLPVAIEVKQGNWVLYYASLPGSTTENQLWIDRKAGVILLKHHPTLYERLRAQERWVDWHKENYLSNETHAIHGGGYH